MDASPIYLGHDALMPTSENAGRDALMTIPAKYGRRCDYGYVGWDF